MNYTVEITPTAQTELRDAYKFIHTDSPGNARRWLRGLLDVIKGLEEFPTRYGVAPDSEFLGRELRHVTFKSHRVVYLVEEDPRIVRVIAIRHGAQRFVGQPEPPPDPADDEE